MNFVKISLLFHLIKFCRSEGENVEVDDCGIVTINGERVPPDDDSFAVQDAMDNIKSGEDRDDILDELRRYLKENVDYDTCVGTEDVNAEIKSERKIRERYYLNILIILATATGISALLAISALVLAIRVGNELKNFRRSSEISSDTAEPVENCNSGPTTINSHRTVAFSNTGATNGGSQITLVTD